MVFRVLFSSFLCGAGATVLRRRSGSTSAGARENAPFMVTSGATSAEELCLVVEDGLVDAVGSEIVAADCLGAMAAGDGRELFSFQSGGLLMNTVGKHCVVLSGNDLADGGRLVLESCDAAAKYADGRAKFSLQGNGQVKLGRDGDYCVSQLSSGSSGGENVALYAAASASSTVDVLAHGAGMAVDGRPDTFWASRFGDASGPVEFSIDFGAERALESVEISWAYAAKEFSIALYSDGAWTEVFSTDINTVNVTRVGFGARRASKAKLVLRAAHPLYGSLNSHALYGISDAAFFAGGARAIAEDCAQAARSADARDKYFLSYVGDFDPCPGKALVGELPALDAAKASLAAASAELASMLSRSPKCASEASSLAAAASPALAVTQAAAVRAAGFDEASLQMLLAEARRIIIAARGVST